MLQWKPRVIILIAVLALIAAALGQLTWDSIAFFAW
jgi:hypothetical protein